MMCSPRSLLWGSATIIASAALASPSVVSAFQLPALSHNNILRRPATIIIRSTSFSSSKLSAYVNVDEKCPRDVRTMEEWAAACGVQRSEGFQLMTTTDSGGGQQPDVSVMTNANVPANSPLLFVPNEMILTGTKSYQELSNDPTIVRAAEQIAASAASAPPTIDGHNDVVSFYLFLKILKEYELGEASPWYPWLNSLPRYYCNGASMTDFCFGCLPPYAAQQALNEKQRLKRFQLALNDVSIISENIKRNLDITKWAYNVVHTRIQKFGDDDYCLVPLADYFNHGGAAETVEAYMSFDENGNCCMYSTRDVPAGRPLNICYGDPTNPSKMLAKYGFLDESSPGTFCKIIPDDGETSPEMINLGYPSRTLFYNDGSISSEVWDMVLYQELGKKVGQNEQKAFYQAHISGDDATKQSYFQHEPFAQMARYAIVQHVAYILNELDELEVGLETQMTMGQDAKRHPRLPLLMRHNEFVKNIFERVQQNLNQTY